MKVKDLTSASYSRRYVRFPVSCHIRSGSVDSMKSRVRQKRCSRVDGCESVTMLANEKVIHVVSQTRTLFTTIVINHPPWTNNTQSNLMSYLIFSSTHSFLANLPVFFRSLAHHDFSYFMNASLML